MKTVLKKVLVIASIAALSWLIITVDTIMMMDR